MQRRAVTTIGIVVSAFALMACGSGDEDPTAAPTNVTPTATVAITTTPTATPTPSEAELAAEVEAAYLAHWDAYAEAVLLLDASVAEAVTAGEELEALRAEVEQLRVDGVALRVVVEHDFQVINVTGVSAAVVDEITNNSFYVDATTKLPEEGEGSGEVLQYVTYLERINGRWLVVRTEREGG